MPETIMILTKIVEVISFLAALFYSVKNYRVTKAMSNIWLYISLAMLSAVIVSFMRIIKEFFSFTEFEIIKVELIPVIVVFFLAATITVRKEGGLPKIIHVTNEVEHPPGIEHELKRGHIYLKKEDQPKASFERFVDEINRGLDGLCITRIKPARIKEEYNLKKGQIVWLTEMETSKELTVSPQLEQLLRRITEFVDESKDSVILLDGIDYLIYHNNFKRVLHFLHRLEDKIAMSNSHLVISISPLTIEKQKLRLLEREAETIEI